MAADPRLANLPALRKLAEEKARAFNAIADTWTEEGLRSEAIPAFERLLYDLTRPASRDAVARLVAERIEVSPGWLISAIDNDDSLSLEKWRWACEYAHMPVAGDTPAERATLLALHVLGSPDAHR